jgi:DNA-binding MarR family transcriptional regulator
MTAGARHDRSEPPVQWLTEAELDSWLSVVRLMTWLPWSIDQQLQRDSSLSMVEYQVMAMLSNRPGRTMRMSSLAEDTNASLSRLSHLVKRLEGRGLVRREPDPADGRFTDAILTDKGFSILADAAPGHVAHLWNQLAILRARRNQATSWCLMGRGCSRSSFTCHSACEF